MKAIKCELLDCIRRNDLLQATLLLGKIENDPFRYGDSLKEIQKAVAYVSRCAQEENEDVVYLVEQINEAIFGHLGLLGKYEGYKKVIDDSKQYYLHEVLSQGQGSPLIYAILFCVLAKKTPLNVECLSFPSNYFIRVRHAEVELYVDPFRQGKIYTPCEFQRKFRAAMQRNRLLSTKLYEVSGTLQLVARVLQQLKHVYILKSDALHALRAVELLTALYPESLELTRDRGVLYCEMEYFSKAITDLKKYVRRCPNADDIKDIKKLANMLRGYRETMN